MKKITFLELNKIKNNIVLNKDINYLDINIDNFNNDKDGLYEIDEIMDDLHQQILDNDMIYYNDCWDYLINNNITDFIEAIEDGYVTIEGIANYYRTTNHYEILDDLINEFMKEQQ